MRWLLDRLVHELWWTLARWPSDQRQDGRAVLREHYRVAAVRRQP